MMILIGILIGYLISSAVWWITYAIAENSNLWLEEIQGWTFGWFILLPSIILLKTFKKMFDKSKKR